jgi:hypothetical protein
MKKQTLRNHLFTPSPLQATTSAARSVLGERKQMQSAIATKIGQALRRRAWASASSAALPTGMHVSWRWIVAQSNRRAQGAKALWAAPI